MRALLSWIRELTPLAVEPGDRGAVGQLASELDALGLVVERVERVGEGLQDVVLARVVEISAIEGADRIRRVVVDRGSGDNVEVVCGAWNFEVGDVLPLAPVGAVLPGEFRIERRKMKGVVSNGMLCSGRELELTDDHGGILVLGSSSDDLELGTPLADHLGFGPDIVFHLDVEPNRPDCLSVLGIARDLAARYHLPLAVPEPELSPADGPSAADRVSVSIEAPELCQQFVAGVMGSVAPVASPPLVQRRLLLSGMRPLGHVVDASNYVMIELGQPTHTYDLDKLAGSTLAVRAARRGERLVTLDGEERVLGDRPERDGDPRTALDIVICDGDDVVIGIGGVMGGSSTEISELTSEVVLEAARFDAVSVGRTARHLGLRSEASMRFERGTDAEGLERAAARVMELVVDAARAAGVSPPRVARGLVDVHPVPHVRRRVRMRVDRANRLLGTSLHAGEVAALLEPIGYGVERTDDAGAPVGTDEMGLVVPPWRPDVSIEVDVIEDVARTFGYRNIPSSDRRSPYVGALDERQALRRRLRRILTGLGAHEAWTSSITDPRSEATAELAAVEQLGFVTLSDPMVAEESVLRRGLVAGLLSSVRHNAAHRNASVRLFEIGDVFALGRSQLPVESEWVALVLARETDDAAEAVRAWRVVEDALGLVGCTLDQSNVAGEDEASTEGASRPPSSAGFHPARSALIRAPGGGVLGAVGEIDPAVAAGFSLAHPRIGALVLDLERLVSAPRRPSIALEVSRYPSSDVDLAFVVDESVPAAEVASRLRAAAGDLLESLELFDVYRGEALGDGARSLAFRLRLCALDRTLTDAEVGEVRERCIAQVQAALPARLR